MNGSKHCPKCDSQTMKVVDVQPDGDDLSLTLKCDDCAATFNADEIRAEKPAAGDPWWIDLEDDYQQHFASYLAQFSGD